MYKFIIKYVYMFKVYHVERSEISESSSRR